ncbi:MAG: FitA-like ribbon-helix-helix domain-containing protein [Beijerinckiaceae bacterium]
MASITVRKIDDELKQRIRVRAAKHGRSLEEEVRVTLERSGEETPRPRLNLAEFITSRFDPLGGIDLHHAERAEALGKIGFYDDWDGR